MPQITAVTPQKKKPSRYNIFLDGHFAFGIEDESLIKHKLKVGLSLTQEEIKEIVKEGKLGNLVNKSLNFLSYRPRSQKEIEDYLAKKIAAAEEITFNQAKASSLISEVIAKLKKYKYINDYDFAKWWLESRLKSNPKGPRLIEMELREKNIDKQIIEKVLVSFSDPKSVALKSLQKKLPRLQKLPAIEFKKKVYMHLASRGFGSETIQETIAFLTKKR